MLRITIHEDAAAWRMKLEGRLCGVWAAEAESVWLASPTDKPRKVCLRNLTSTDEAGKRLLEAMHAGGATLATSGVENRGLLDEIMRRGSALVAGLALMVIAAHAQTTPAPAPLKLTLKDAVTIALRQNPEVAIANLNAAEGRQTQDIARSALLPQASFKAVDTLNRGNIEALLGRKIPGFPAHVGPYWAIQAGPGFSTPLFDLTLWHRWQAARESTGADAARQTTARELNAQLVVSQYLGCLRAAADVEAAKTRLELARTLFNLATDLQKNGVGTSIDTLRAHVQFQNETQRSTEAGTQLQIALYGLNHLLNLDPRQTVELADGPSFFETPAFDADASLAHAWDARPEMKTLAAEARAAEQRKTAARDERLPKLTLAGGWSLDGMTPTTMVPAYQYGASLEVPLFTGGRIHAETTLADLELRKLNESEREVRNQIALEVKSAGAQLESARTEVDAANLGVTLARESLRQAQDRFRAGVANNIEVVTAQDELSRANDNQIQALYRYNQSRADLAHSTGQMETIYSR